MSDIIMTKPYSWKESTNEQRQKVKLEQEPRRSQNGRKRRLRPGRGRRLWSCKGTTKCLACVLWILIGYIGTAMVLPSFWMLSSTTTPLKSGYHLHEYGEDGSKRRKNTNLPPVATLESLFIPEDDPRLAWDPFAIAQRPFLRNPTLIKSNKQQQSWLKTKNTAHHDSYYYQTRKHFTTLRSLFLQRYGTFARSMLAQSVKTVHSITSDQQKLDDASFSIATFVQAVKTHLATTKNQPLDIVVVGNGAAAGYGNYRSQAYSHQFQQLLHNIVNHPQATTVKATRPVHVTNLAMDQSTEFPHLWCIPSLLQQQQQQAQEPHILSSRRQSSNRGAQQVQSSPPFMVVWDYVGSTPPRLEAVLRFLLQWGVPVVAVRLPPFVDHQSFEKVLARYCPPLSPRDDARQEQVKISSDHPTNSSKLFGACLLLEPVQQVIEPFVTALGNQTGGRLPPGLDGWYTDFGTGRKPLTYHEMDHLSHQRPHYLTKPQHSWIAWTLAMPFLSAAEFLLLENHEDVSNQDKHLSTSTSLGLVLPPPLLLDQKMLDPLILASSFGTNWNCYTSYEYVLRNADMSEGVRSNEKNKQQDPTSIAMNISGSLSSIIVSRNILGTAKDLLRPKLAVKEDAWLYDLDDSTKFDKRQMQHHKHHFSPQKNPNKDHSNDIDGDGAAFYGMPDWKIAYYGAYQSGVLKLRLPVDLSTKTTDKNRFPSWLQGRRTIPTNETLDYNATDYIQSVILCQSDAPMVTSSLKASGCSWVNDVQIRIGMGKNKTTATMIPAKSHPLDTSYDIVISTRGGTRIEHVQPLCRRVSLPPEAQLQVDRNMNVAYLPLEVEVTNPRVLWHPKHSVPCSLSHVLVENKALSNHVNYKGSD